MLIIFCCCNCILPSELLDNCSFGFNIFFFFQMGKNTRFPYNEMTSSALTDFFILTRAPIFYCLSNRDFEEKEKKKAYTSSDTHFYDFVCGRVNYFEYACVGVRSSTTEQLKFMSSVSNVKLSLTRQIQIRQFLKHEYYFSLFFFLHR